MLHAQKLYNEKVKTIRPDGAKELAEGECNSSYHIKMSQINVQKRVNRTIFEKVRTILLVVSLICSFDRYKSF